MGIHQARQAKHSRLHRQRTWSGIAFLLSLSAFIGGLHWSTHIFPLYLASAALASISLLVVLHFEIAHTNLHPDCGNPPGFRIF